MIFRAAFLLLFSLYSLIGTSANYNDETVVAFKDVAHLFVQDSTVILVEDTVVDGVRKVKFKRGKAIIFCLFTGILGGHRIYLGTHQRTPIIYSITLGGFGILPLVDLIHLIFTKDLSKFENKSEIIMWGK